MKKKIVVLTMMLSMLVLVFAGCSNPAPAYIPNNPNPEYKIEIVGTPTLETEKIKGTKNTKIIIKGTCKSTNSIEYDSVILEFEIYDKNKNRLATLRTSEFSLKQNYDWPFEASTTTSKNISTFSLTNINVVTKEETKQAESAKNTKIFKDSLQTRFETGIAASFGISDADYNKYKDIMDYLNKYPQKSEAELFEELAGKYGTSATELRNFMNANMEAAIKRDQAKTAVKTSDVDNLVKKFFEANAATEYSITTIQSEIQGTGTISKIRFTSGGSSHDAILKFRFLDGYKTAYVLQLKIDNVDIPLE